jgi:hypothetical protein
VNEILDAFNVPGFPDLLQKFGDMFFDLGASISVT